MQVALGATKRRALWWDVAVAPCELDARHDTLKRNGPLELALCTRAEAPTFSRLEWLSVLPMHTARTNKPTAKLPTH